VDTGWLKCLEGDFREIVASRDIIKATNLITRLERNFLDIMSFGLYFKLLAEADVLASLESICGDLEKLRDAAADGLKHGDVGNFYAPLRERLDDYLWQIDREVLAFRDSTLEIMPSGLAIDIEAQDRHFLAWGTEQVLQSIDKLEVRGRDSAGISIAFTVPAGIDLLGRLSDMERAELFRRSKIENADTRHVLVYGLEDGRTVCRFLYKVAQLVGQLGDNGDVLRRFIREDALLWSLADGLSDLNVVAHTRWASNGIISVPNCHPVDGVVLGEVPAGREGTMFVLNGDVDNYSALVEQFVSPREAAIPSVITTDAKILPVLFHMAAPLDADLDIRFRGVFEKCEGSLAVVMQDIHNVDRLFLAQKGSGQSFYIGRMRDGWSVASEAYGLVARCRVSYPIAVPRRGGVSVFLQRDVDTELRARYLEGGAEEKVSMEPIEIFSRDIFRGNFEYYIEKEMHEASQSVRNTLHGKYRKEGRKIRFLTEGFGNGPALIGRLRSNPRIKRIIAVGQGTAAVAAMGISQLLRRTLVGSGIAVESYTGSELIGFVGSERMDDLLLVPVSQSGTTTDTNRVVDLCRSQGAWVNAIVNRRNSPLIKKSHSYIYTSNGRDVEMAVASTKAFYSQIAAGKVLSLWLGSEFGTVSEREILSEIESLEDLPGKIDEVLARKDAIGEIASRYAPSNRYWALVGNGANCIAAKEVRIKLSELCYKSIPCDVTEDKKHIDLSTEPLTLVMASDLPEMVATDTVKEVTIFKAHSGKPIVFCAEDEDRFDNVAEAVIKVPRVGGGLDFVLETVAGHWWGIAAAKAIDAQSDLFKKIRILLGAVNEDPGTWNRKLFLAQLEKALELISFGGADSALPANIAASLANYVIWLHKQPENIQPTDARLVDLLSILNAIVMEMTRPIDTVRHQAKTVTVGISRPQKATIENRAAKSN